MAIQISERPMDICLDHCPYMRLNTNTATLYAEDGIVAINNTVSCEYEKVCKMWNEEWRKAYL